jgi:hypothetical protein
MILTDGGVFELQGAARALLPRAKQVRFDIVEVLVVNGAVREIRHLPNAFPMELPYRYGRAAPVADVSPEPYHKNLEFVSVARADARMIGRFPALSRLPACQPVV